MNEILHDRIAPGSSAQLTRIDLLLVAVLAISSIAIFSISLPWGIGIRPDSAFYLGFPVYLHSNAPGYAWLISMISSLGTSKVDAALVLNAFLFAFNAACCYFIVWTLVSSRAMAMLAGVLYLTSPLAVDLHLTVLSEGLFVACILVQLVLLSRFVEQQKILLLVGAALATSFAFFTRFNAVPLFVLGPLAIAVLVDVPVGRRVRYSLLFLGIAVLPIACWLLISKISGATGLGRPFGLYGNATIDTLKQGVTSVWLSFLPSIFPFAVQLLGLVFLIAALCLALFLSLRNWFSRQRGGQRAPLSAFPPIAIAFIFGHFLFLLLALVIEANLPLKASYMLPVYPLCIVLLLYSAGTHRDGTRLFQIGSVAALALCAVVLVSNVARSYQSIVTFRRDGIFYAGPTWLGSQTASALREMPQNVAIYSNAAEAVYFLTRREQTHWIPMTKNRRTGLPFHDSSYENQLRDLREKMDRGEAVVVFFDRVDWRFYLPEEARLVEDLELSGRKRLEDGTIYSGDGLKR